MRVFLGIKEMLTMAPAAAKLGRKILAPDLGLIKDAAIVEHRGIIEWVGPYQELKKSKIFAECREAEVVELNATTVLPGFVECHTHSVFAGDRKSEFELRNQGASYQQIAEQGGGIISTVRSTREAPLNRLVELAQQRVDEFVRQGVTTLEIKSGYGLSLESEIKILEAAGRLSGPRIVRTFLGPHALSPDFKSAEEYMQAICDGWFERIAQNRLAERADIYVEKGYFTIDQAKRYFKVARAQGFHLTGHMDQLNHGGGCELGVQLNLNSIDHCVNISDSDIQALARTATVAVLLPTADLYIHIAYPPARKIIDAGCVVALATDFNPGSSPTQDLSLVGVLARLEMKMTLPEVLGAYTVGAALALDSLSREGSLQSKKICNFMCLDGSWQDLFYAIGGHPVREVWREGKLMGCFH